MRKFNRIVVLDNLLLPNHVWEFLKSNTLELVSFADKPIHGKSADPSPQKPQGDSEGDVLAQMCEISQEYTQRQIHDLVERIGDADAIISCWTNLPDAVLSRVKNVKYIFFWTHSFSHRVNQNLCAARKIHVDNVPDYGTHAVTEYVFASLLTLNRSLLAFQHETLRGSWAYEYLKTGKSKPDFEKIPTCDLRGKSLGIIGLGRIGTSVAIAASLGFGMKVCYFSKTRKREIEKLGIQYEPLSNLCRNKDVVSLHLPSAIGAPVITRELMSDMRRDTMLINTSSGVAMDEDVALELAEEGHLRLVMDVYKRTPPRQRLKRLSAISGRNLFTYRAAWYTKDAIELKARIMMEKVGKYLSSQSQLV